MLPSNIKSKAEVTRELDGLALYIKRLYQVRDDVFNENITVEEAKERADYYLHHLKSRVDHLIALG